MNVTKPNQLEEHIHKVISEYWETLAFNGESEALQYFKQSLRQVAQLTYERIRPEENKTINGVRDVYKFGYKDCLSQLDANWNAWKGEEKYNSKFEFYQKAQENYLAALSDFEKELERDLILQRKFFKLKSYAQDFQTASTIINQSLV